MLQQPFGLQNAKKKRKSKDKAKSSDSKKSKQQQQNDNWHVGFKLTELSRTSGDFKYIDQKMHSSIVCHNNGIEFESYDILSVHKVLNSDTYDNYRERRRQMNLEIAQAKALGNPDGSYVEEMRLWHGSPYAEKICSDGFNLKPAKANGMFGKGIYFAEHSSKSNQYSWGVGNGCPSHHDLSCFECPRQMLLCKVALGRKYLTPGLINNAPQGIDTVVARPETINYNLRYPEYIIYKQDQAYPGYLIKYKILPPKCAECKKREDAIRNNTINAAALPTTVVFPGAVNQCPIS